MDMDAPTFRLTDENGEPLDSSLIAGMTYVLCAVPGLSQESEDFLASMDAIYQKLMVRNTPVLAAVPADRAGLADLRDRLGLRIKLLSDPDCSVYASLNGCGRPVAAVISRDGTVTGTHSGPDASGQVYSAVKALLK